jgi:hypothetical protein
MGTRSSEWCNTELSLFAAENKTNLPPKPFHAQKTSGISSLEWRKPVSQESISARFLRLSRIRFRSEDQQPFLEPCAPNTLPMPLVSGGPPSSVVLSCTLAGSLISAIVSHFQQPPFSRASEELRHFDTPRCQCQRKTPPRPESPPPGRPWQGSCSGEAR